MEFEKVFIFIYDSRLKADNLSSGISRELLATGSKDLTDIVRFQFPLFATLTKLFDLSSTRTAFDKRVQKCIFGNNL